MAVAMLHSHDWYDGRSNKAAQLMWSMFFLPVDIVALGWAGMWLGMTSKGRGRAMMIGLAVVLLLPCVLSQVLVSLAQNWGFGTIIYPAGPADGLEAFHSIVLAGISLVINLAVIVWAQARLLTNFRRMALSSGSTSAGSSSPACRSSSSP